MAAIGFIGAGNMAEALIRAIIRADIFEAGEIMISDTNQDRLGELGTKYTLIESDNLETAQKSDIIVLCIKPQQMDEVLKQISKNCKPQSIIVSIAAGVKISKIEAAMPDMAIVRVMPNTPALIGEGASVLCANSAGKQRLAEIKRIFQAAGKAFVVEDESLMDTVTALSGSGPAYFFMLMEEMAKAAVELGLDEKTAMELTIQTAKGAAVLAENQANEGIKPAELRRKVTSPGGTTQAALQVFEQENLPQAIHNAIKAAHSRAQQLSR